MMENQNKMIRIKFLCISSKLIPKHKLRGLISFGCIWNGFGENGRPKGAEANSAVGHILW